MAAWGQTQNKCIPWYCWICLPVTMGFPLLPQRCLLLLQFGTGQGVVMLNRCGGNCHSSFSTNHISYHIL